jgi:hypothetical protein
MCLPIASKALAPLLWLLASEAKDGQFDGSLDELVFRLHITPKEYDDGLKPLIDKGFFIIVSGVLAECKQVAIPETEGETEKETETKERKKHRGTRLPTDFEIPDDWISYCQTERPDLHPHKTFDAFKDYWIAAPKGTKLNWMATWRNWVRSQKADKSHESFYERDQKLKRERMREFTPHVAVLKKIDPNTGFFIEEVTDVHAITSR